MKHKIITLFVAMCLATAVTAQTANGGISADMLRKIESAQKAGPADKALFNAIA